MILVLGNIKRCKDTRGGWRELAEIMQDKNQRVISLLGLYAQAPEKYADVMEQANKYQKILNEIASDMRRETDDDPERASRQENYWETMKHLGREVALLRINAERIGRYRERLRDQTLNTTEIVGIQLINDMNQIRKLLAEHMLPKPAPSCKVMLKPRPPLVDGFVGRRDILDAMHRTHFEDGSAQRSMPRVTVLTGLGGSGKTQIALKFASEFEQRYPGEPVYFLDASSQATLESDLKTLVQSQSDVHKDALIWLASTPRDWLVIMDNADDPSLELAKFLPRCTHGHIVITSRNRLRTILSPKSAHRVDSLPLDDATTLLLGTSGYEDNEINRQFSKEIAQELGRLPLALAHAGAYIFFHQCLDGYLEIYRESGSELLGHTFDMAHDYPYSVARTVKMSFEKLAPRTRDLMGLFSHLDARSIPRSIIERAASRHFRHIAKDPRLPLKPETTRYADSLKMIISPNGAWSLYGFNKLIEECENYSLVRFAVQDGEKFYSMHVLVQTFLQATCGVIGGHPSRRLVARLLGSSITIGFRWEYIAFNRSLFSHLRLVDLEDMTEAGDHYGFGIVMLEINEGQLALGHMERCVEMWKGSLGQGSEVLLDALEALAWSYSATKKEENALGLRKNLMEKRRELLGEDHPYSLVAINSLASSYSNLGRYEEALLLREEASKKLKRLLGDDHPNTLLAISSLAITYSILGRHEKAVPLKEDVLEKRSRLLGDDNPVTLMGCNNLAYSYLKLGRVKEALPMAEHAVERLTSHLGEDNNHTLAAIDTLAHVYTALGKWKEALPLAERALKRLMSSFGEDHPDTLAAMDTLARVYVTLGKFEAALPLAECVVEKWTKRLGKDNVNTLAAMDTLAKVYAALGRGEDSLKLQTLTSCQQTNAQKK
ncbi:TPR-like protein [Serendipita vermifera]|nr:TPR-like protein [Serendipita vermifera]